MQAAREVSGGLEDSPALRELGRRWDGVSALRHSDHRGRSSCLFCSGSDSLYGLRDDVVGVPRRCHHWLCKEVHPDSDSLGACYGLIYRGLSR